MPRVWISLGSNQERERSLCGAVAALGSYYGKLIISPVYEGPAIGFAGDPFYNLVVGLDTADPAQEIVKHLRGIEEHFGRIRNQAKFAARTLDLDLLTWGTQVLCQDGLVLPREEITRYAFVLRPLADIAGAERHPVLGQTYSALWDNFDSSAQPLWPVNLDLSVSLPPQSLVVDSYSMG